MEQHTTPSAPAAPEMPQISKSPFKKPLNKWLLIGAIVVLVAAAAGFMLWRMPSLTKLGVDLAHTEGTVEYRLAADKEWQAVPSNLSLTEGAEVRTMDKARAILNIDDGSAIRLNSNSSVALKQLSPDHIVVENTGGDVYTRVIKSDTRKFEVVSDGTTYRSEGTGYRTVNTEQKEGVEVYHSEVTILGLTDAGEVVVAQGERYYKVNLSKPTLEGKVTELSANEVAADTFMQWNSEEDKKEFSSELGVLFDISPPKLEVSSPANGVKTDSDNILVRGKTEEGAKVLLNGKALTNNKGDFETTVPLIVGENSLKVEAIDGAGNKSVKTIRLTRNEPPTPEPEPQPTFVLYGTKVDKGVSFSWNISGIYVSKGFKIVKSLSANPTYPGSESQFVDASARSFTWKIKDGKTYHFRICTYHGTSGCSVYSNNITVTAPYITEEQPEQPSGSLTLSHTGGNDVSWVLNGSAPYGFKLVWSNSVNPTYPGSSATFYDKTSTTGSITNDPGTYYVRICMYYDGGCKNYSNQVTVTLP
jgi:ferric-dicitrate binding protein FerR (iron transport regulator)